MRQITHSETTMPRRAYSYRRISTGGRQQRGRGLDRQEKGEQICRDRGWILDDTIEFVDVGKSGFHRRNLDPKAALGRFLGLVARRTISPGSVLIVESLDRLSRADVDDAYDLFRQIIKAGITIVTVEPDREYSAETSGNMLALLEPLFIFARANEESRTKSYRSSDAWEDARAKARAGANMGRGLLPRWIRREGDSLVIVEELAEDLRMMVRLVIEGHGLIKVAERMNGEGRTGLTRKGRWRAATVRQTLTSAAVVGTYQPCRAVNNKRVAEGQAIEGYYPSVLTHAEWQRLRATLASRKHKVGRPAKHGVNLFTGLVRDAVSRRPMSLMRCGTDGGKHAYLSAGQSAGCARVRYEAFEKCVLDLLDELRPEDVLEPSVRHSEREQRIADLTSRVTALAVRQSQLQKAAADPNQDVSPLLPVLAKVSEDLKAAAAEQDALKLESATGRAEALVYAQTLRQLRDKATAAEREELDRHIKSALPSVVSEIWVQCQRVTSRKQIAHVQIHLRSGGVRNAANPATPLNGVGPWPIHRLGFDFRSGHFSDGNVSDAARLAIGT